MPSSDRETGFFLFLVKLWNNLVKLWNKWRDYFGSVVKPCRFSVLMLIVVSFIFLVMAQGQDVLRSLGENESIVKTILFFGALVFWAFSIWYWGRQMLLIRYSDLPDHNHNQADQPSGINRRNQHRRVRRKFPRFLGFIAFLVGAVSFASASFAYPGFTTEKKILLFFSFLCLALGAGFLVFVHKFNYEERRKLSQKLYDRIKKREIAERPYVSRLIKGLDMGLEAESDASRPENEVEETYDAQFESLGDLPLLNRIILNATIITSIGLFTLFLAAQGAAAFFGAATIVLLAASSWVAVGSFVVYKATKHGFPIFSALLVWAIVMSCWNDNHQVRVWTGSPDRQASRRQGEISPAGPEEFRTWSDLRPTAATGSDFAEWLNGDGDSRLARWDRKTGPGETRKIHPVFFVAAEGGGIRAAYWAADVLAGLQNANPEFADHVYALSGVSGGSLGIAVFSALLAEKIPESETICSDDKGPGSGYGECIREICRDDQGRQGVSVINMYARCILGSDFLAPTLAYMLYPDLVQRLLFFPVSAFDRSLALEKAWEASWEDVVGNDHFSQPFHSLFTRLDAQNARPDYEYKPRPRLFLNSTWVETGKRVIGSNLRIDNATFRDSVDFFEVIGSAVPLSSVVHNSARFTYVSPAGLVKTPEGQKWGHLVDGGYFENSGGATADEILAELEKSVEPDLWARILPIVIMIVNDPDVIQKDRCDEQIEVADGQGGIVRRDKSCDSQKFMNEVLSPPRTLWNTRNARGSYARAVLKSRVEGEDHRDSKFSQYLLFSLTQDSKKKEPLPLGWSLSRKAKEIMDSQLRDKLVALKITDKEGNPSEEWRQRLLVPR